MTIAPHRLLAVVELGGYPNFTRLYGELGFTAEFVNSQRKALAYLKKQVPDVIVAEYNFQSDFRDRSSNLETLMAQLQRFPEVRRILFHQAEHSAKFAQMRERFHVDEALVFPVDEAAMRVALERVRGGLRS